MRDKVTSLSFQRTGPRTDIRTPATIIEEEYGSVDNWHAFLCAQGQVEYDYIKAKTQVERWAALRRFYNFYIDEILAAPVHKYAFDPYGLQFLQNSTPIEQDAWMCIRSNGLVLYPQYPAHGFFLDYAHPKLKVAVEMDGKQWHDAAKDAIRDEKLKSHGWTVFRIPGAHCYRRFDYPHELAERHDRDSSEFRKGARNWYTKTSEGVFVAIREKYFSGADYLEMDDADFIDEALTLHCSTGNV